MEDERERQSSQVWNVLGKKLPRNEVVYFSQVFLIYIVIIACIVNLSRGVGDSNLWTCLLSSGLGYLLPNPSLEVWRPPRLEDKKKATAAAAAKRKRKQDEPDVLDSPQQ